MTDVSLNDGYTVLLDFPSTHRSRDKTRPLATASVKPLVTPNLPVDIACSADGTATLSCQTRLISTGVSTVVAVAGSEKLREDLI